MQYLLDILLKGAKNVIQPNKSEDLRVQSKARETVTTLVQNRPVKLIDFVDDNVAGCLPPGSRIRDITPSGEAYWTQTAAIGTEQPDGSSATFFLKVSHTDVGRDMLRGEFASMNAIRQTVSDLVPIAVASGTYAMNKDVHFNLFGYIDMTGDIGQVEKLPATVAELHSKGISPTGKYGFSVPTSQGALLQPNTWTSSWEKFFTDMIQRCFDWEQDMHGKVDEMQRLFIALKEKVIPRLLRPLETGGRQIKPCLVHGDLWDGNTSVTVSTDKPVIFDASSLYAHHEFELGAWNQPRHQMNTPYITAYHLKSPISEPVIDRQDRLILYRIRFNLTSSGCYLQGQFIRELVIQDMKYLTGKYPEGYEGSEPCKAEATLD